MPLQRAIRKLSLHIVVIAGPTACGKTRLGVELAHELESEIISADSRQVYRELDLGTGKDLEEYTQFETPVPFHLIDIVDPEETYTLFQYQQDCYRLLREKDRDERFCSGKVPLIMVGGSGLYVETVVRDFRIADVGENKELRNRLANIPLDELVAELERENPELAEQTDTSSGRRVVRALEIAEHARSAPIEFGERPGMDLRFSVFCVDLDRSRLRRRIGDRLRSRLTSGMVAEVRGLLDRGLSHERLEALGLEYREIAAHLRGSKSYDDMVNDLEHAIGRFAKRQQTWFRGMERRGVPIRWIEPHDTGKVLDFIRTHHESAS